MLPPGFIHPGDWANKLNLLDDPRASRWGKPLSFASGGGGLVSTADDYLAFCRMMLGQGRYQRARILSPASVALMTIDHLTDAQKEGMEMFFGDGYGGFKAGWGFGMGIDTKRVDLYSSPGRLGWVSGLGTAGSWDPQQNLAVALRAPSKEAVHQFHSAALKAGAKDNGPPGFRRQYGDDYYAAFVLDFDGNNMEACYFGEKAPPE